jgi:hypothetical protein
MRLKVNELMDLLPGNDPLCPLVLGFGSLDGSSGVEGETACLLGKTEQRFQGINLTGYGCGFIAGSAV